jgi:hypothetical protein
MFRRRWDGLAVIEAWLGDNNRWYLIIAQGIVNGTSPVVLEPVAGWWLVKVAGDAY